MTSSSLTILSAVIAPSSRDFTRFWSDSVTGISLMDTISSYFLKKKNSINQSSVMFKTYKYCSPNWVFRVHEHIRQIQTAMNKGMNQLVDQYLMFLELPKALSISMMAVNALPLIETRANLMESSGSSYMRKRQKS